MASPSRPSLTVPSARLRQVADAIFKALTMPLAERRGRSERLRRIVEADDVSSWFKTQLADLGRYVVHAERDPGALLPDGSIADGLRVTATASTL